MNNDTENMVKRKLEDELCEKYGLEIKRVEINLRPIWKFGDEYMNHYITGGLFYFLALPIVEHLRIGTIYRSMEYEYAMTFNDWDLSINPRFSKNLYIKEDRFPLLFSVYNAFPKVMMLHELAKTDFVKYIYSCFNNTGKRWCGKCSKCFRISEYCDRIGLNRQTIGMKEDIVGLREKSSLAKNYWLMMDMLYKRRYMRELKLAINYYLRNKLLK